MQNKSFFTPFVLLYLTNMCLVFYLFFHHVTIVFIHALDLVQSLKEYLVMQMPGTSDIRFNILTFHSPPSISFTQI